MKGIKDTVSVRKKLGQNIQNARTAKGLSRPQFAALLLQHDSAPTESRVCKDKSLMADRLKQWEYGNNPVELEWIPAICDILGCDVGYLFGEYTSQKRSTFDVCQQTGLSEIAAKKLQSLSITSNGHKLGAGAKGFNVELASILSCIIESNLFCDMLSDIGLYLIYGGILLTDAYTGIKDELSKNEYEHFYSWANASGLEIIPRCDVKEMYLQKASDSFKRICEEVLEHGKHKTD